MKRTSFLLAGAIGLFLLALVMPTQAEDKEITITGEAKCGKCALKETEKCQNVIQVEKDGKKRPAADSRPTAGVVRYWAA